MVRVSSRRRRVGDVVGGSDVVGGQNLAVGQLDRNRVADVPGAGALAAMGGMAAPVIPQDYRVVRIPGLAVVLAQHGAHPHRASPVPMGAEDAPVLELHQVGGMAPDPGPCRLAPGPASVLRPQLQETVVIRIGFPPHESGQPARTGFANRRFAGWNPGGVGAQVVQAPGTSAVGRTQGAGALQALLVDPVDADDDGSVRHQGAAVETPHPPDAGNLPLAPLPGTPPVRGALAAEEGGLHGDPFRPLGDLPDPAPP